VSEIDAASADETALLRAAYNLRSDALMPEDVAAEAVAGAVGAEVAGPLPDESPASGQPASER
jgi:hypothetical protein